MAIEERKKRDEELRTRRRKKIKCGGCGVLVDDAAAFQAHCRELEHDEDFCYDCTEVEVTEMVANATDD
jgi:hypothetical protein